MRKHIILSLLPGLAFACTMGLGTHKVDDLGRTGPQWRIDANNEKSVTEAGRAQVTEAIALGCSVDPSKGFGGFAVSNVVHFKKITDPTYFGTRHGVDNMDDLTVYRVSFDEGWTLAHNGQVRVIMGCAG